MSSSPKSQVLELIKELKEYLFPVGYPVEPTFEEGWIKVHEKAVAVGLGNATGLGSDWTSALDLFHTLRKETEDKLLDHDLKMMAHNFNGELELTKEDELVIDIFWEMEKITKFYPRFNKFLLGNLIRKIKLKQS